MKIKFHFNFVRAQRGKFCTPANAVFLFENRHFLTHRPPDKIKLGRAQRGNFFEYIIDFE